jgi:hypothetical protein
VADKNVRPTKWPIKDVPRQLQRRRHAQNRNPVKFLSKFLGNPLISTARAAPVEAAVRHHL